MDVGHLFRDADLVGVEIGDVLFAVFGVVKDLRQRFVAVLVGVEMGVAAFVGVFDAVVFFEAVAAGKVGVGR